MGGGEEGGGAGGAKGGGEAGGVGGGGSCERTLTSIRVAVVKRAAARIARCTVARSARPRQYAVVARPPESFTVTSGIFGGEAGGVGGGESTSVIIARQ